MTKSIQAKAREQRLAAKLRENLKRRKGQVRARADADLLNEHDPKQQQAEIGASDGTKSDAKDQNEPDPSQVKPETLPAPPR